MSFAAHAQRCARLLTSEATTAKPPPWSPARAASTEALIARMFVGKAMPLITPVISAIFRELSDADFTVSPTRPKTARLFVATVFVVYARPAAAFAYVIARVTVMPKSCNDRTVVDSPCTFPMRLGFRFSFSYVIAHQRIPSSAISSSGYDLVTFHTPLIKRTAAADVTHERKVTIPIALAASIKVTGITRSKPRSSK
jgi:hypothetical protein